MKHLSGFVPINFSLAGKILFISGLILAFLRLLNFVASEGFLVIGLGLLVIGIYLIFFNRG